MHVSAFFQICPDDKHSNTQYIKQNSLKYAREKTTLKTKQTNFCLKAREREREEKREKDAERERE